MNDLLFAFQIGRLLQITSGFFWMVTYILIIYHGLKNRKVIMPFAALCANITWEALFLFIFPIEPVQSTINAIWFILDCVILFQLLIYDKTTHSRLSFKYIILLFGLTTAFLINLGITLEFQDMVGKYTAFGMNFMMSLLFVNRLLKQGVEGHSTMIGYTKLIGTSCASILFAYIYPKSILLFTLFILIFILDLTYIILIKKRMEAKGL